MKAGTRAQQRSIKSSHKRSSRLTLNFVFQLSEKKDHRGEVHVQSQKMSSVE
ncbi:Hypothetical predicted protein [Scomber scombrus]|uniref:Uncharacterized protein n=1 Tax=Scomber scombrus TaxID=13677 RepID=A0AAV1PLR1_SCOSC